MAGIPNQSNIAKTIKSQVAEMDTIISAVVKAATSKTITLAKSQMSNIKDYQTTLATLFDKKGVVSLIVQHTVELSKIQSIKMPNYRLLKRMTKRMLNYVDEIASIKIDVSKLTKLKEQLAPVTEIITSISEAFNNIAKMEVPSLFTIKFLMIKLSLWRISKLGIYLGLLNLMMPVMVSAKVSLTLLSLITSSLVNIFMDISNTKLGLLTFFKINLIAFFLRRTMGIVRAVSSIGNYILRHGGLKDALILSAVFNMLESVFKSIKAIKVGIFMQLKLRRILKTLRLLERIARRIARIRIRPKALASLINLQLLFSTLAMLLFTVILITPVVLLSIPAMIMVLIGIKIFAFVMRMIIRTLVKLAFTQALKGMLAIALICGMLLTVAIMLLMVSFIAETVMDSIWNTIKFLLVVVLITVIIAGFGMLVSLMAPIIPVIGIGLLIMLVIIGIVFLIAVALRFIQMLDLDTDLIKENVGIVIDTCRDIIEQIFNQDDEDPKESDKGWLSSLMGFIGEGLTMIIQAVLAVAYLASMMAGVLCILLMATMLRLLQELDLDVPAIEKNVGIVIETCKLVMHLVFDENDSSTKETSKSWLESLFDYMGSGLIMIIKAIFAVAFLACALIAITMILLMAAQLRLLQEIELDVPLIEKNVGIVIDTCFMIIRSLFDRDEEKDKPSSKSFLVALIDFICPELALIIEAIFAVAFLAMSIFVILLINLLALQLRGLQEIDLNGDKVAENVEIVCQTAQQVIDSLYNRDEQPDKPSSKSWIRKLLEFLGLKGLLNIIDAIMAMAWLGMTVGMINMIHLIAQQLTELTKINLSSNITKKVEDVCNTADKVSNTVKSRKYKSGSSDSKAMKILKWMFPKLAEIVEEISKLRWVSSIMSTVGVVTQVADTLKTIESLPDIGGIYDKAKYVCDTADEIARMVTERAAVPMSEGNNRLTFLERLNKVLIDLTDINPSGVMTAEQALEGHMQFIEKLNSMDITKLETSAKLFEHISDFSRSINGNFYDLAACINQELMPTLERLEEILRATNDMFGDGTNKLINTIKENGDPARWTDDYINEMVTDYDPKRQRIVTKNGVTGLEADPDEKSLLGAETDENKARKLYRERLINDKFQAQSQSVAAKLDMIYDILSGCGSGASTCVIVSEAK